MQKKKYPYLGINHIDGKPYVVLFNEPDMGMVVVNETDDKGIIFGMYGSFAEEMFEVLPPDVDVILSN